MTEPFPNSSESLLQLLLDKEKLKHCQDCGKCTSSCPMARAIPEHYNPRRLLMKISLDATSAAKGDDLWLCAWCYRCTERCPEGLEPTEVFMLTRNFAAEAGFLPKNARKLIEETLSSGRTLPASKYVAELREDAGLPRIGETIGDGAMRELWTILGSNFVRRIKK